MLKSIELSGFKSFAKRSVIDVGVSTVAIVGPNGSGKSNTAEAFRFVLGEQSIKSMRGKRGEDLIWGGTDVVPRSNRASVRIHFDNKNRLLNIDFDEVVIERIVHRDASNEYFINGSRVRLKDITALLASANIGSSGHHIISQGQADRILNAGANERRNILEDALGLKVFQFKKIESEKRLAKTQENIKKIESTYRELTPHLKFLERQMKKRERGIALREELQQALKLYLARENTFIKNETIRLKGLKDEPVAKLEAIKNNIASLQSQKEDTDRMYNSANGEMLNELEKLDKQAEEYTNEYSKLTREIGQLEGKLQLLEGQKHQLKTNEEAVIRWSMVEKFTKEIITESDIVENTRELELLRNTLRHIGQRAKEFVNEVVSSIEDVEDKRNPEQQFFELQNKKIQLESKLEEQEQKIKELEVIRQVATQDLSKKQNKNKDTELEILELVARRSELKADLRDLSREETELERISVAFKEELREAVALLGRAAQDFENIHPEEQINREVQEQERRKIERIKIRLEETGLVSDDVVEEYKNVCERSEFLEHELKDLNVSGESLLGLIDELENELASRFEIGLTKVNEEFQNFFEVLFGGGKAKLNLIQNKKRIVSAELHEGLEEEYEKEVENGVEVGVQLPRKKISSLDVLSGGERALTSIALIFAMSQVNPPPFLILDETDAALDEANSKRYADMVRTLSEKSQLILITHNRETMAAASELYGVTMGADGVSRLLSVKLDEAIAVAK